MLRILNTSYNSYIYLLLTYLDCPNDPWGFPDADTLQKLYDKCRTDIDHVQIMDVVLWSRWDKSNGVATIMMSTLNLQLMEKVQIKLRLLKHKPENKTNTYAYSITPLPQARHVIRICTDFPGMAFETYNKRQFVKRFGITMYVTRDNANLPLKRIMRSLFYKNPSLKSSFEAIHVSRFVDNPPDYNPARRSRIGDIIYLLDSPSLADKLRAFPEDFKFQCGGGFTVTLKGGIPGSHLTTQFTKSFASSVMLGAAAEAMRNAQSSNGGP